jgi:hypothetical protein
MSRLHPVIWILLGLFAGGTLAYVRDRSIAGDFSQFGTPLKNPKRLQNALTETIDGSPGLKNITIYNETVRGPDGKRVAMQIVTGNYCGLLPIDEPSFDARSQKLWRPIYFISEPPFQEFPTITAYLDTLHSRGVTYRFAWWRQPRWWYTLHIAAGLLVVGIIWPIVINLLSFGTLTRPEEVAAPILPPSPPRAAPAPVSTDQLEAVTDYTDDLSAALAEDETPAPAQAPAHAPAPVAALKSAPVEPTAATARRSDKEFGADKEDYYPTERHAPKQK